MWWGWRETGFYGSITIAAAFFWLANEQYVEN